MFERKQHASWHDLMEGYRSIRNVPQADFDAVQLFVAIRHLWFVGEYASRVHEWGSQAVPATGSPHSWRSCCHGKGETGRPGVACHFRFEACYRGRLNETTVRSEASMRRRDFMVLAIGCTTMWPLA